MKTILAAMVMLVVVSVGVSALTGCAEPGMVSGYDVSISSDFSAEEVSVIETQMSAWSAFRDGPTFNYNIVSPYSLPSEENVSWTSIVVRKDSAADIQAHGDSGTIAYTAVQGKLESVEYGDSNSREEIGATIYLQDSSLVDSDMWAVSVAHETGHACGLRHTGINTLMNPDYPTASHSPTCADLNQFCSIRGVTCTCDAN